LTKLGSLDLDFRPKGGGETLVSRLRAGNWKVQMNSVNPGG
jgi:hypothetical protein